MIALQPRAHHHTVTCPAEEGLHPVVRRLIGMRYGYSAEPRADIVRSGTFNLHRNAPLGMIGMAGELLIDEGLIPADAPYLAWLERFADRYTRDKSDLYSTKRETAEVEEAIALMDAILNDIEPEHGAFREHFEFVERTHIPETRIPWKI